jgi:tryptophan-rich sensory protein
MTDLAFGFPLTALCAIWLWRRRPWGYPLAGAFLVYGVIEAVSVASDQFFMHLDDPSTSAAAVPLFVALTLIGLVPAVVFLRHLRDSDA